jgi:hypothetical protein
MLYAMLEASDPASCYRVYFTKNAANTKDSTDISFCLLPIENFIASTWLD